MGRRQQFFPLLHGEVKRSDVADPPLVQHPLTSIVSGRIDANHPQTLRLKPRDSAQVESTQI